MLLTSIGSAAKKKSLTPKPLSALFRSGRTKGIVSNQIETLEESIQKLTKQSTEINEELFNLKNSRASKISQEYLIDIYQKKVIQLTERVEKRKKSIQSLEGKLKSFIQVGPKPQIPAQSQTNPNSIDLTLERQMLINEHTHLTEVCIYNDRMMVLSKIKLRLCHDHRDLYELQKGIDCLKNGTDDIFKERIKEKHTRQRISNLKMMIQMEKRRINQIQNATKEDEAATIIQKTWRGFNQRRKEKKKKTNTPKPRKGRKTKKK